MRRFRPTAVALALAVAASGCAGWSSQTVPSTTPPMAVGAAAQSPAPSSADASTTAATPAAPSGGAGPAAKPAAPDPKALADVLGELQTLGAIDPATQARLIEDMKRTDPALWPQMMQVFRASIAYRQQQSALQSERARTADPNSPIRQVSGVSSCLPEVSDAPQPLRVPDAGDGALAPAAAPPGSYPSTGLAPLSPGDVRQASATREERKVTARTDAAPPAQAWNDHLAEAIRNLEIETTGAPQSTSDVGKQATLRMLYLLAGRRDEALRPISGVPAAQQDFWSKEMFGLAAYLDVERVPDATRRASEAALHLRDAAARLGEQAGLQLRNLAFCSEVSSFGVYKKFDSLEFAPGQQLLLYVEVENFKSDQTDKGFHTALKTSYQVLDSRGARVAEQEFAATEEYCQNPRRDYFLRYFIFVPKRIYNGKYTLQLTVEDAKSQKIGQSSIEFTVKEK
jgi:hypothetical protein